MTWTPFCNWLGLKVKFKLLGQWYIARVWGIDDLNKTLTVELTIDKKRVRVTAPYQAFRKVEEEV